MVKIKFRKTTAGRTIFVICLLFLNQFEASSQGINKNLISLEASAPSISKVKYQLNSSNGRILYYFTSLNYRRVWEISRKIYFGPSVSLSDNIYNSKFNIDQRKDDFIYKAGPVTIGYGLYLRYYLLDFKNGNQFHLSLNFQRYLLRPGIMSLRSETYFSNSDYYSNTLTEDITPDEKRNSFGLNGVILFNKHKSKHEISLGLLYFTPQLYEVDLKTTVINNGIVTQDNYSFVKKALLINGSIGFWF